MKESSLEIRVGIFFIAAILLLIGFVLLLQDVSFFSKKTVFVDFAYAGSLQKGALVKISGVKLGNVSNISLLHLQSQPPPAASIKEMGQEDPPIIRATLQLEKKYSHLLSTHTKFFIGMQGVIGESYIELVPGEPRIQENLDSQSIRGIDAPKLHVLAREVTSFANTLHKILSSPASSETDNPLLFHTAQLMKTLNTFAQDNKPELKLIVHQTAVALSDLTEIISEIKKNVQKDNGFAKLFDNTLVSSHYIAQNLPQLMTQTTASMNSLEVLAKNIHQTLMQNDLNQVMKDLKDVMHHMKLATQDTRTILNKMQQGQGTIGGFIVDPQVFEDFKAMLQDLKKHPWKLLWRN